MNLRAALLALLLGTQAVACGDTKDDEIRAQVTLLVNHEGQAATNAAEALARYGRRAIPTIEAALHTSLVPGRRNLVMALRKIGDPAAIPLLRHLAVADPSLEVQHDAEWTLKEWAAGDGERAEKARAAMRAIDEQKGTEEAG
jgi:HEAT repeat protein